DKGRIGIIGHSEGGLIASMIAADDPNIKTIVLLGTLGHSLSNTLLYQYQCIMSRLLPKDQLTAAVAKRRRTLDTLQQIGQWDAPEVEEQVRQTITPAQRKWFQEYFTIDPRNVIRSVHASVAIFHGGRDIQVDPDDAILLGITLDESGHHDHLVRIFPNLDHLFMRSEGFGLSEYADPDRSLDPELLEAVIAWILIKLNG
ncbi:MAG: hypothetical protein PHU70_04890, partial [Dehalococcoidia bacterium]|nr:hypothetical protein [Dehalococcoidia bacterium]